jgi:hypothetical protein
MEQEKFHDQLVAMLTKKLKRTDDGERKIDASENRSESEVRTTMGSKKLEDKLLEVPQQPVQEVVRQKNQETMKEVEQSNVEQSIKMKMSDDRSKFGGVTVDSQSPETPARIVLSPKALDWKLGSTMKEVYRKIEQVIYLEPPPEPPDTAQITADLSRREQPPKPPDLNQSTGRERDTQPRVEKRGKKMQTNLGESAASKLLESPFIGYNSVHENFVVTKRQKILEKLRAKWTICDFNIFLNLLGQIHKSPPSILHNYDLLHVLSSG